MQQFEIRLNNLIHDAYNASKEMKPTDGLSSPRDIELAKEINRSMAFVDKLQDAMKLFNPNYEIRDN